MAEPITVEFELGADDVTRALGLRTEQNNSFYLAGALVVGAGVCFALYAGGHYPKMWMPSALLAAYAIVMIVHAVIYLPRRRKTSLKRLTGSARVVLGDDGVRYGAQSGGKGFSWPKVARVIEKPDAWILLVGKNDEGYVIPRSAVAEDETEGFTGRLKEWSGKSYRVRKR